MIDKETIEILQSLSDIINDNVDKLIKKRDNCKPEDIYTTRYVCRRVERAVYSINQALDKANLNRIDFKL